MRELKINIKPSEDRLDKFIASKIKDLTRSKVKKLIIETYVTVNDHSVDPSYKIRKNDSIKIEIPLPKPISLKPEKLPLKIIHEDESILVLEKEAGMVVHPTADHPNGTLVNAILYHLKSAPSFGESLRPGIVHRLDKGTSGVIVVAKKQDALENLKSQFKSRKVAKKYIALVGKRLEPLVGSIDKPIGRHPTKRNRFTISKEGKPAVTNYRVKEYIKDAYSLVEVEPETGRTHQIRVHLSCIGHPILGDKLYGGKAAARIFLHASFLEFTHPETQKKVSFASPLPSKLAEILIKIKKGKK